MPDDKYIDKNGKEVLGTIQIGRRYIDLLTIIAKSQIPKTSMRQYTERWIVAEASRLGLLKRKGE